MVPGVVVMHIGSPSIHPKKKYENKMLFEEQWIDLKEKSYIHIIRTIYLTLNHKIGNYIVG